MTETESQAERQKRKMQKLKTKVDQHVAACDQERGVMILLTGDGKGKSSSAFVMDIRLAWFSLLKVSSCQAKSST